MTAEGTLRVAEVLGFKVVWDRLGLELEATSETTDAPPQFLLDALKANGVEIVALLQKGTRSGQQAPPGGDPTAASPPPPPPGGKGKSKLAEDRLIATHFAEEARNHAVHLSMIGAYAIRIRPWGGGGQMASLFRDGWYIAGQKVTDPATIEALDRVPRQR